MPEPLARFIAPKGSITIDGVSLTVNTVGEKVTSEATAEPRERQGSATKGSDGGNNMTKRHVLRPPSIKYFTVNIIPHTAAMTGFGSMKPGDAINLEIDLLARYVARLKECA